MGLGFQHGKQQFKRTLFEIYEHMKRGSYNELCSCVETVITVISAVFRGNYVSSLSCRVRQSSLPGQGPKIYFGDALTIVFHLVLDFFLPSVSKGKAKWECWPYWEQSSECTVYTIVVVEQRRHSHLPSSCSLVLLFTLMLVLMFWAVLWTRSRKGSKTKAWQGGEKGFFCFVFQQCCLLAENCVDTTESGEPWCGGGSYLHQLSCQRWNTVQLYPQARRALFHAGPEAKQTMPSAESCDM